MKSKWLLGIALIAFFSGGTAMSASLRYQETTGNLVQCRESVITPRTDGYTISAKYEGGEMTMETDAGFSVLTWKNFHPQAEVDIWATRNERIISLVGHLKGKPYQKVFKINSDPWYQDWGLGLQSFILSGAPATSFWSIEPKRLMIANFKVNRKGLAKITVSGREVDTIYVTISLAGIAGFAWSADYWFRATDGREIASRTNRWIGAPETVSELVEEG